MAPRGQDSLSSLTQTVSLVEQLSESETLQLHALIEARLRTVYNRPEFTGSKATRESKSAPKPDGKAGKQKKADPQPKAKPNAAGPSPLSDVPVFKEHRHNERLVREQTKERGARSKVDKEVMAASVASSLALFWYKQDKATNAAIAAGKSPSGTIMVSGDGTPAAEGLRRGRIHGCARHFNEAVNFFGSTEEAMKNASMAIGYKALRRVLTDQEIIEIGAADPDAGWTKPKKTSKTTPPGSPKSGAAAGPSTAAAAASSANRFTPLAGAGPADWADGGDANVQDLVQEQSGRIPTTQPRPHKRQRSPSPKAKEGAGPASKKQVSKKGKGPARA